MAEQIVVEVHRVCNGLVDDQPDGTVPAPWVGLVPVIGVLREKSV